MKTTAPEVGMNIITSQSAQFVTIREVHATPTKSGATLYRLRVTPEGVADAPGTSRWTTVHAIIDLGNGWQGWN